MYKPFWALFFLLSCTYSPAFADDPTSQNKGWGGVTQAPSESECRTFIEAALKEQRSHTEAGGDSELEKTATSTEEGLTNTLEQVNEETTASTENEESNQPKDTLEDGSETAGSQEAVFDESQPRSEDLVESTEGVPVESAEILEASGKAAYVQDEGENLGKTESVESAEIQGETSEPIKTEEVTSEPIEDGGVLTGSNEKEEAGVSAGIEEALAGSAEAEATTSAEGEDVALGSAEAQEAAPTSAELEGAAAVSAEADKADTLSAEAEEAAKASAEAEVVTMSGEAEEAGAPSAEAEMTPASTEAEVAAASAEAEMAAASAEAEMAAASAEVEMTTASAEAEIAAASAEAELTASSTEPEVAAASAEAEGAVAASAEAEEAVTTSAEGEDVRTGSDEVEDAAKISAEIQEPVTTSAEAVDTTVASVEAEGAVTSAEGRSVEDNLLADLPIETEFSDHILEERAAGTEHSTENIEAEGLPQVSETASAEEIVSQESVQEVPVHKGIDEHASGVDSTKLTEEILTTSQETAQAPFPVDSTEAVSTEVPVSEDKPSADKIIEEPAFTPESISEEVPTEVKPVVAEGDKQEAVAQPLGEGEKPAVDEASVEVEEIPEQEDLTLKIEIPEHLRSREHIFEILKVDNESAEIESKLLRAEEVTLRELKKVYENAIMPLEILYKYRDLSNRHFGDPEIFSKPLILFMGPWSGGKSTIINYLLDNEYKQTALRTGAEPSPAYFNIAMWGEREEILDGTQLAADWTFSGLQKFGQGLLDRLRGLKMKNPLLEKVNIVEIPGILEIRKQVERLFPLNDACQWFIDRADIIFLVYDPSKLDVGPETEAILDQLKGREYQTKIILNKADQVKPEELMRVQGTLIWNISPLMSSTEPPVMYSTSLWSHPYQPGSPSRLLFAQEKSFLKDLREAMDKRVENKISSARRFAVRVRNHAKMVDCYLTTYYNHKTFFGDKQKVSDDIIEHPQNYHIYEGLSTLTNISRYDLPDPDVYKDFFRLNPVYDFQQLAATCTYFKGCPIHRLDVAIAYDLPEMVGKYKKMAEDIIKGKGKK